MQHKMLVTVVLLAGLSLALAVQSAECPPPGQANSWHALPVIGPVDDNSSQGSCREVRTDETDFLKVSGRPAGPVEADDITRRLHPFMDWGNDIHVGASVATPTLGQLSADVASNGDMYVGLLAPASGVQDTVYIWRSTNGGANWSFWSRINGGTNSGGLKDFYLRVGSDAGGDWVYVFGLYDANTTDGGLWVRRSRSDLSAVAWRQIVARGDTLINVVADRNIETPQHLFVAYQSADTRVNFASSADSGQTWGNFGYLATDRRVPAICAGGDKYVYIGALLNSDSCRIRIGRQNNNLIASGGSWAFVNVDSGADHRFYNISVAAGRTTPGASQTAIILSTYRYNPNGNVGPRYGWTTNGGTSYNASLWPPTNQGRTTWDFRYPYIRMSYTGNLFRAVITGMEPSTSFDTVFYAFSRTTAPTTWEDRATVNDYSITGEYGANVDYSTDLGGGFVAYREYGEKDVWVDGWNWTGVEEGKTPARRPTAASPTLIGRDGALDLSLPAAARVKVQLLDGTGRLVETVHDGRLDAGAHRLPIRTSGIGEGVYFLNLDINGQSQSTKLVHVR